MTEIRDREFGWGGVRGGHTYLNSMEPLKDPYWASFMRDAASCGFGVRVDRNRIIELDQAFVRSERGWRRLVFIPQVNEQQLAIIMARPEYEEAKNNPLKLRKLFVDVRNSNGH